MLIPAKADAARALLLDDREEISLHQCRTSTKLWHEVVKQVSQLKQVCPTASSVNGPPSYSFSKSNDDKEFQVTQGKLYLYNASLRQYSHVHQANQEKDRFKSVGGNNPARISKFKQGFLS